MFLKHKRIWCLGIICLLVLSGCAAKRQVVKRMEVTAYCGCGKCCSWERGHWKYLKLDFWNRYVNAGPQKGQPYSGLTASGTKPREPKPGFFSIDSIKKPWMIPIRLIFFPWLFMPKDGTLAADTRYYPFGTRMFVPGYGYGKVEDRGGAIKGRHRLDAYIKSHRNALKWGRQNLLVRIE